MLRELEGIMCMAGAMALLDVGVSWFALTIDRLIDLLLRRLFSF